MGASIGEIQLDLGINSSGFKSELNNATKVAKNSAGKMSKAFGKMAIAAAAAFAAKAVVNFSKQCIQLGSDLAEVQNVVDVTFGNMSDKVNDFAKNAMTSYGLSEKVAKQYMGTFGAMSKAFGYTEVAAYEQAAALTGLAGDVASFYNLTTDEAYTKLKSVFTGETESLKDLGVVMTQTALDEYAVQQGMGKTTSAMSEQEKVALRLAFVTDRLSLAAGDFSRTSDGWANQTRVLSLRFDALKASIGQGLINVLTPVIKLLNHLMVYLQAAADAFRDFTTAIFGDAGGSSSVVATMPEASAGFSDNMSDAAGSAAAIKKSLAGFDQINVLSSGSSGSSGGGSGDSVDTSGLVSSNGKAESSTSSAVAALDTFKEKLEEIANWTGLDKLWDGIKKGIGKINFDAIKTNFSSILDSLKPIAKTAFDGLGTIFRSYSGALGKIFGGVITIVGKTIELTTGGIAKFLESEKGTISQWIEKTSSTIATGYDNLGVGAENISGALVAALTENQPGIETSISNILSAFSTVGMTVGTIFADMWEGLATGFAEWSIEFRADIENFFSGTIESITRAADVISSIIGGIFKSTNTWWEEDGKRVWDEVVNVFFGIVNWVTRIWNEVIKPVIDNLTESISELWEHHLQPFWEKLLSFFTSVWDFIKMIWDGVLKPVVDWVIATLGPVIVAVINTIVDNITTIVGVIIDAIGGIFSGLGGLLDFITGVFTGDWGKAWEGIGQFLISIFDGIWIAIRSVINLIIDGLNGLWTGLYSALAGIINGVGGLVKSLGNVIGQDWGWEIPSQAPQIPRLATGGYVAANSPQLAIIGDNKREGEIVAPESKIAEAVAAGVAAAFRQFAGLMTTGNKQSAPIVIKIGEEDVWAGFIDYHNSIVKRTGDSPLLV